MIGIDGCKLGYMTAMISDQRLNVHVAHDLSTLKHRSELILIDVPIGCPCSSYDIRPEPFVRMKVKPRTSSVFNVPALDVLNAKDYDDANRINKMVMNKGLSRQSYSLVPMIKEVNEFVLKYPHVNIHESFPELIFAQLKGQGCEFSKHTPLGFSERYNLIIHHFPWIEKDFNTSLNAFNESLRRDVIDAVVLACAAFHIDHHGYQTIPGKPHRNCQGIEMKMMILNS